MCAFNLDKQVEKQLTWSRISFSPEVNLEVFVSAYEWFRVNHLTLNVEKSLIFHLLVVVPAKVVKKGPSIFLLVLVVQTLDGAIHRIHLYPADSLIDFRNTYPVRSAVSNVLNNRGQMLLLFHSSKNGEEVGVGGGPTP